jgi:hypothetical protein
MRKEKKFCIKLPQKMHEQIWRKSGNLKINLVAESLLVEYLVDPNLQNRVKKRIRDWRRNK